MQVDKIIVGHAGDVVHNDLVGLGLFVGLLPGIPRLVYIIYVVTEDGGVLLAMFQILQQLFVDLLHHGFHHPLQDGTARFIGINDGVILPLVGLNSLEMGLVQHDIGLAVAVFDDVHHQIVNDLGIDGADDGGGGEGTVADHLNAGGILAILAQVSDDVGDANYVAFQSGGLDLIGVAGDGVALFQLRIELLKAVHGNGPVLRQLDLAVVAGDSGEYLQRQVQGEDLVQNPGGMDIVIEITAGVLVVQAVQEYFTTMGEGSVADVVTQGNGLNQIQIQVQGTANGSGDAANQLNV